MLIFSKHPNLAVIANFIQIFQDQGFEIVVPSGKESSLHPGQLEIEQRVLDPLRQALVRGELIQTPGGIQLESPSLFMRVHEAEIFAEMLVGGIEKLADGIRTARLVRPMERRIKFNTTGGVNGYIVQNAILGLRGEKISFYVLRGANDMIRLAFFIRDQVVYKRRKNTSSAWISNVSCNSRDLAELLRANNFIDDLPQTNNTRDEQKAINFHEEIEQSVLPPAQAP